MTYKIVSGSTPEELALRVNEKIALEWTVAGGMTMTSVKTESGLTILQYTQSMVHDSETQSPPVSDEVQNKRDGDVYREEMAELRWRRDQDRHYLTIFFAVCTFCVAAYFALLSKVPDLLWATDWLWVLLSFIVVAGVMCIWKISLEHEHYGHAGRTISQILARWKMIATPTVTLPRDIALEASGHDQGKFNFSHRIRERGFGSGWKVSCYIIVVMMLAAALMHFTVVSSIKSHPQNSAATNAVLKTSCLDS